jgi:hypothetical protein
MYAAAQTGTVGGYSMKLKLGRPVSGTSLGDREPNTHPIDHVLSLPIAVEGTLAFAGLIKWRQSVGKKDEYCAAMESEIKNWDAEVDNLNAKTKQMSADARVTYDTQLKALRADRDLAYSKLKAMRMANESAWQHMQSGVEAAWASMKNGLDKAASQFK